MTINTQTHYYKRDDVVDLAHGNWIEILGCLGGGHLDAAFSKIGRHVGCPVHGGKDGFRLMPRVAEKGAAVCNTCGFMSDGFAVLQWLNDWDFKTALNEVGDFVRAEQYPTKKGWAEKKAAEKAKASAPASPKPTTPTKASSQGDSQANAGAESQSSTPSSSAAAYLAAKNGDGDMPHEPAPAPMGVVTEMPQQPPIEAYDDMPPPHDDSDVPISAFADEWAQGGMMTACGHQAHQPVSQPTAMRGHVETQPASQQAMPQSAKPAPAKDDAPQDHLSERRQWLRDLQQRQEEKAAQSAERSSASIERIWEESFPITSTSAKLGRSYLEARGIRLGRERFYALDEGECFRFHPNLAYYGEAVVEKAGAHGNVVKDVKMVKQGEYPALICAIRNPAGEIVTLHRTYLAKKGGKKAPVKSAKKMMSVPDGQSVTGGAIRLSMPTEDGVLAVAEGLETALSGLRTTGLPTWCLVNTTLLENFEPPKGVHTLVVWADKDKSGAGEHSANRLKARMQEKGIKVVVLMPPMPIPARGKGVDWNDVLMTQGLLGFPRQRLLDRWIENA